MDARGVDVAAEQLLLQDQDWAAPRLWRSEVRNVLANYVRAGRMEWTDATLLSDRAALIQRWVDEGKMKPVSPEHLLYMLWATTQHYADFGHQIETLNAGPLTDAQWQAAKASVKAMILRGIGAI